MGKSHRNFYEIYLRCKACSVRNTECRWAAGVAVSASGCPGSAIGSRIVAIEGIITSLYGIVLCPNLNQSGPTKARGFTSADVPQWIRWRKSHTLPTFFRTGEFPLALRPGWYQNRFTAVERDCVMLRIFLEIAILGTVPVAVAIALTWPSRRDSYHR